MPTLTQQLQALVATGNLDKQTAGLLLIFLQGPGDDARWQEAALRQLEQRIGLQMVAYWQAQAARISQAAEVTATIPETDSAALRAMLTPELGAAARLGSQATWLELAQAGVALGVNWQQANTEAATWAADYTYDLVRQLDATTRSQLQAAISTWQATPGLTRADLERLILEGPSGIPDLVSRGGRIIPAAERAEMIAVTEVTRSYSMGNVVGLRATGLEMVEPEASLIPPRHVLCRCDIKPFTRADGVTSWRYNTLNDDLVCDLCAPWHGQDVGRK